MEAQCENHDVGLYRDSCLQRILRLLQVFTSLASTNEHACKMMQAIANPEWLTLLFTLYERTHSRNQITVLKCVQSLIQIGLPTSIFEMIT
jgi:hypothetical protein